MSTVKAAILDRDGTIIVEQNYLNDPAFLKLLPNSAAALRELKAKGYLLFVVSNQSGVARGLISQAQFQAVHRELERQLAQAGVTLDGAWYCVHDPKKENCPCRKPGTALIPRTWQGKEIDFGLSLVAGDKRLDLDLGTNLGARSFLVMTGYGEQTKGELEQNHGFTLVPDLAGVAAIA